MKRILLLTILTVSTFVMASAQQTELPQVRAKKMVSKVNVAVGLQGAEWGKVNATLVEYFTKFDELEKQKAGLGAGYVTKLSELKSTRDANVKAALTPDQAGKYDALVKNIKE